MINEISIFIKLLKSIVIFFKDFIEEYNSVLENYLNIYDNNNYQLKINQLKQKLEMLKK